MVSTRTRIQRSKTQKYAVGDKVEVVRGDGLAVGFLLSKAEDEDDKKPSNRSSSNSNRSSIATTATTHWVVSVEGGSEDEEVISEKGLGRVLEANDSDESATFERDIGKQKTLPARKGTKSAKGKPSSSNGGGSDDGVSSGGNSNSKLKKAGTTTATPAPRAAATAAATAKTATPPQNPPPSETVDWCRKRPAPRPKKEHGDEEVVEFRLNTGTLFMYRGKNRRVEYIQRV